MLQGLLGDVPVTAVVTGLAHGNEFTVQTVTVIALLPTAPFPLKVTFGPVPEYWSPVIERAVTVKLCWTWAAAFQLALPAWLASSVQLPAAVKVTTPPDDAAGRGRRVDRDGHGQARGGRGGRGVRAPPTAALAGAVVVKLTVWVPLPTAKVCWTWAAAFQLALPAWLASSVQLPAAVKVTTPPAIEQLAEVDESTRDGHGQARGGRGGRGVRGAADHRVGRGGRGEADRLGALAHGEALLDLGRRRSSWRCRPGWRRACSCRPR